MLAPFLLLKGFGRGRTTGAPFFFPSFVYALCMCLPPSFPFLTYGSGFTDKSRCEMTRIPESFFPPSSANSGASPHSPLSSRVHPPT